MTVTQTQIDELTAKLMSGVASTSVDGLSVQNASASEMIKALQYGLQLLSAPPSANRPFRMNHFNSPGGIYGAK